MDRVICGILLLTAVMLNCGIQIKGIVFFTAEDFISRGNSCNLSQNALGPLYQNSFFATSDLKHLVSNHLASVGLLCEGPAGKGGT